MVLYTNEPVAIADVLWTFSYLTDGTGKTSKVAANYVDTSRVITFISSEDLTLKVPAIRVIGNVCAISKEQSCVLLDHGALVELNKQLVTAGNEAVKREVCWAISNIAAGPSKFVEFMIKLGVVEKLAEIVKTSIDYPVKNGSVNVVVETRSGLGNNKRMSKSRCCANQSTF